MTSNVAVAVAGAAWIAFVLALVPIVVPSAITFAGLVMFLSSLTAKTLLERDVAQGTVDTERIVKHAVDDAKRELERVFNEDSLVRKQIMDDLVEGHEKTTARLSNLEMRKEFR